MSLGLAKEDGRFERTVPLLKQNQLEEYTSEKNRLSNTLNAPPHLRNAIQDAGTMYSVLKRIEKTIERDTAREYVSGDIDKSKRREAELREKILSGMPTQEEMRRNPPGALDKHMNWEARNKQDIAEWKNIRRRQWATGMVGENVSDRSVANLEMFRPRGGAQELNMDNAQIPQARSFHGLGGRSTTFSDDELALIERMAPKLKAALALLSAEQRDEIKEALVSEIAEPVIDVAALDGLSAKDARERCKGAGLESGGSREDLIERLQVHYGKP